MKPGLGFYHGDPIDLAAAAAARPVPVAYACANRMGRIQADEFLAAVTPALDRGDVESLCATVKAKWSPSELCGLLQNACVDTRRTAVVTLGMVGDRCVVGCLTRCLHDPDGQVHQFAEDALWSIWFRGGRCEAVAQFRAGVDALADERYGDAVASLHEAIEIDPAFAEAHNQLAIAHYMAGDYRASMCACRKALALMPTHFGAMTGLGHGHAHQNELPQAIDCYRRALAINPHMPSITQAKARLEEQHRKPESCDSPPTQPPADATRTLDFDSDPNPRG